MGGGVFELGNPEWREAQAVLEIQVYWGGGGGGQKTVPSVGGVWIFFWNNPLRETSCRKLLKPAREAANSRSLKVCSS